MSLEGLSILVTGTSSGLGEAVARVLVERKANVMGMARREEHGDALAAQLGKRFCFFKGDVASQRDCAAAVAACVQQFGGIDVLINNAGTNGSPPFALLENSDEADQQRVFAINLAGPATLCRAALPHMKRQKRGLVLNVASVLAVISTGGMASYSMSKAGMVALTRSIAVEGIEHGIRANVIILGGVRSAMAEESVKSTQRALTGSEAGADISMFAEPMHMARAIAALCEPDAAAITGSEIQMNNAMTAGNSLWALQKMAAMVTPAVASEG